MRRHGKRDTTQHAIVQAFEQAGRRVFDLSSRGDGCPDLLVRLRPGDLRLVEVKTDAGTLTPMQRDFHARFPETLIVRTLDDVITLLRSAP